MADDAVMRQHTAAAEHALLDGAHMGQALEDLWRAAYACGVGKGKAAYQASLARHPANLGQPVPPPGNPETGWTWGLWSMLGVTQVGTVLRYGGMDPAKPNSDRKTVYTTSAGEPRLFFTDTGERLKVPAGAFWANLGAADG